MADEKSKSWARDIFRPLQTMYREVIVSSLFVNMLALAVPVFTLQVFDRVITTRVLSTLQGLAIGMVFVLLFDFFLRQTRSRIMQRAALRIDVAVGKRLFEKIMALPLNELVSRTRFPWTQNWLNRSVQGGPEHDRQF